ncbi:MAG: type IV secretion system DNA-binding domain-containing protein [Verrucomicrobiota bacterium]
MLLNSDEVVALAHLPTAAVRAKSLRRALQRTRRVPAGLAGEGVWLGDNLHEGVRSGVHLPLEVRLNHCHILGGTGSGKSTLLALMAAQDMKQGHGVAVIDPHGDLIDALLPHVPPERLDDVILFDPSDEDHAIAFNPLAASSTREKELLAADFIAVMRQHTSSWGDQMSSLLGNAVLAFLHNSRTGTLPELRRFLVSPEFCAQVLKTVTSPEVVYFWEHEAALASKSAIGSILVRLDELLRSESLLHILGQRANKLDFADIMDSRKIFLARLSKGLVGQANAYLLGSLLVSKFYQTTIARQSRQREQRRPYMLLMDEAGELLTSTISEILVGARKYGLGLTLAHQSLRQLSGNDEVYGAVTGSCGTKICFQVGGDDARKMADEFGGFVAADLMNLPKFQAIARVGPRDAAFNLETYFLPQPPRSQEEARTELLGRTRRRYCTPKDEIRKDLEVLREFLPKRKPVDPFSTLADKQTQARKAREAENEAPGNTGRSPDPGPRTPPATTAPAERPLPQSPPLPPPAPSQPSTPSGTEASEPQDTPENKAGKAEAIKNALIQASGGWGFAYETEHPILGGKGRVDIVLTKGNLVVACEISATTSAPHEVPNVLKCLEAGFARIIHVCNAKARRTRLAALVAAQCAPADLCRIEFLTLGETLLRLGELASRQLDGEGVGAGGKTVLTPVGEMSAEDRNAAIDTAWANINGNKSRDRRKLHPPG